jgi:hypothetical protein
VRDEEKISRYINDLRYEIQDEISMMTVRMIEDAVSDCAEIRGEVG